MKQLASFDYRFVPYFLALCSVLVRQVFFFHVYFKNHDDAMKYNKTSECSKHYEKQCNETCYLVMARITILSLRANMLST